MRLVASISKVDCGILRFYVCAPQEDPGGSNPMRDSAWSPQNTNQPTAVKWCLMVSVVWCGIWSAEASSLVHPSTPFGEHIAAWPPLTPSSNPSHSTPSLQLCTPSITHSSSYSLHPLHALFLSLPACATTPYHMLLHAPLLLIPSSTSHSWSRRGGRIASSASSIKIK
jgi:hypothetical protein